MYLELSLALCPDAEYHKVFQSWNLLDLICEPTLNVYKLLSN